MKVEYVQWVFFVILVLLMSWFLPACASREPESPIQQYRAIYGFPR